MKAYIKSATAHLEAAASRPNTFDYPKGSKFNSLADIKAALHEGKTIEDVYFECIVKWGTITGAVANRMGYVSHSTQAAVRKGLKILMDGK